MENLTEVSLRWLPLISTFVIAVVALSIADRTMRRRASKQGIQNSFARQMTLIVLTAIAAAALVLALPMDQAMKDQVLGLLGLAVTAMIALSSTTFVSNAMAGLMSRSVGSFKVGDFICVNDRFGRVTERGLFHTEIQSEDRDLITLPNLYLVTHPVSVVRRSGTAVSATVSLGYDVDHTQVEPLLLEAAKKSELEDPFVRVMELGDFSVTYRVAGILKEVTQIVSARSRLNAHVLDTLHQANIEIMSPNVMAQRPLPDGATLVPKKSLSPQASAESQQQPLPEDRIFDKAERAAERERLQAERAQLAAETEELAKEEGVANPEDLEALPFGLKQRMLRIQAIDKKLELMGADPS